MAKRIFEFYGIVNGIVNFFIILRLPERALLYCNGGCKTLCKRMDVEKYFVYIIAICSDLH